MHECIVAFDHDRVSSRSVLGRSTEWVVLGVGVNLLLPGTQQSPGDSCQIDCWKEVALMRETTFVSPTAKTRRKSEKRKAWSISASTRNLIAYLVIRLVFLAIRILFEKD
jgi:hypothetical protein